ncbi:MAG TPA: FlgD immunoglobulin-like domain containing protein [bacterium]|nr:FlgD immunoglobulin-like domain containing protein [bacterium]
MSVITSADLAGTTSVGYETTTTSTSSTSDLMTEEVFLELLMTEMQYQDPLDPMDNQQFLSQLSQLTTVEELRSANTNLETLQLYQASINNAQSVSLIGKEIRAAGDTINLTDDEDDAEFSFDLQGDAQVVTITIYDANDKAVRSITKNNLEEGLQVLSWDGLNNDGSPMDAGEYTFTVTAEDADGNSVTATTLISGIVTGVSFDSGTPVLHIGSQQVTMGDIMEVMQGS